MSFEDLKHFSLTNQAKGERCERAIQYLLKAPVHET